MSDFLRNTLWRLFALLPIHLTRALSRILFGRKYIAKAKKHGQTRLAARLKVAEVLAHKQNAAWEGVILIGGVARVGKTIVAHALARKIGGYVVEFDRLKHFYSDLGQEGIEIKLWMVDELCKKGQGIIIEGDGLIMYDDVLIGLSDEPTPFSVTPQIIRDRIDLWGAQGFCLGAAEDLPADKYQGLLHSATRNKCWATSRLDDSDLHTLAHSIVSTSRTLRAMSKQVDVPYFEIHSKHFKESIRQATHSIANVVTRRPQP